MAFFRGFSLLLALAQTLGATSAPECLRQALIKRLEETEVSHITAEDEARIAAVFDRKDLGSREKARQSYEIATEARLRSLPKQDAEAVRRIMANARAPLRSRGEPIVSQVSTYRFGFEDTVYLRLPEPLRGTLVEYFARYHEMEHLLQHRAGREFAGKKLFHHLLSDSELRFVLEKGAMRREFEFLRTLPLEDRRQIVAALAEVPELPRGETASLARQLLTTSDTPEAYLEVEWKAGRYSRESFATWEIVKNLNTQDRLRAREKAFAAGAKVATVAVGSTIITALALNAVCAQIAERKSRDGGTLTSPERTLDRLVCSRF